MLGRRNLRVQPYHVPDRPDHGLSLREPVPLVAQHQFVAILRAQGWRAPLIGTWTPGGAGEGVAPDGGRLRWVAPPDSDDANEKGTWSSVWTAPGPSPHPDVATAVEVAGLGEDVLIGPLGPQGRYRRRGLELFLGRVGLEAAVVRPPYLVVGAHRIHLASGAVVAPDGQVRPRDPELRPLGVTDDPGLGRILAEALRLRGESVDEQPRAAGGPHRPCRPPSDDVIDPRS